MNTHLSHCIRINLVLLLVLSVLLTAPAARAATITVTNANDSGAGSLRQAILDAGDGDTITFDPALTASSPVTISLSTPDADIRYGLSAFTISSTLTIQGPTGPNGVTLARATGIDNLRLFYVTDAGNLTLQHLTLSNGLAQGQAAGSGYQRSGGGGGGAGMGGAIFNQGQLNLANSTLTGNQALGGASRSADYSGGGGGGGGGLAGPGASGTFYTAGGDGGAPLGGAGSTSKEAAQPNGEAGGVGGGGGGGGAGDHTFDPNFSTKPGGAGGAGGFGAGGGGGGAYDSWGSGGNAGGAGGAGGFGGGGGGGGGGTPGGAGGIGGFGGGTGQAGQDNGNLGGYGGGGAGLGGAIFNDGGAVTLTNSTLSDNSAVGWHDEFYPATDAHGYGAGIFSRNGTVAVLYSTLALNNAEYGGGLYLLGDGAAASATLNGAIVAGAEDAHDIQASAINGGLQTTSGADNIFLNDADFSGSYVKADPLLGPLQNNGGPTWTRALDLDSPALDAVAEGANGCGTTVTADQRGVGRPAGSACDLGAFESTAFNLRIVKTVSGGLMFMPGQAITYTLAFSNTAGLPVTGVIITDHVPSEVTSLSYSASGVTITNTGASPAYVWQVDDLAPRAGGVITITGNIDPGLAASGRLTNTASIAPLDDASPDDNTSTAAAQICTQAIYTVTDDGDSGPGTLRQTIIDACPNSTVDFSLTYPAVITLTTGEITIDKSLTILGPGADQVRVDGNGASGVLSIASNLTVAISDLTISGGYSAQSGGGIFADAGTTLNLNGVKITGNAADLSGGGLYAGGSVSLTNTDVVDNIAYGSWPDREAGGGAYVESDVTLVNGRFENNQASDSVGGGLFTEGSLTLNGTQFISNTAALAGGGAQVLGTARLTGGRFERNRSNGGGGGGGLRTSDLVLTDTIFISNTAENASVGGGGVLVVYNGAADLTGGEFISNTTSAEGGGLLALGDATLAGTEFRGNSAADSGGGARISGEGVVTGGLYQDNLAGSDGGGLFVADTLVLTGARFLDNQAMNQGGGLHAEGDSRIVNALFANNTTDAGGAGAAISLFGREASGYLAEVVHTTIVGSDGDIIPAIGAYRLDRNELAITNTVVAAYSTGFDVDGSNLILDYDLFYNVAVDGIDIGAHSITGTNPLFADPAGGDYRLTSASPALDAGAYVGVTTDIDGEARPVTSTCFDAPDIGADEFVGLTVQRPVADSVTFGATRARLVFNDPASVSFITVTVVPGLFPTNNPADQVVSRTITIAPDVPGAVVSATLALCYDASELKPGLPEEQVQFYRRTGASWQGHPSTVDVINHAVTTTQVVGFSHWMIGIMSPTPTAIALEDLRSVAGRSVGDAIGAAIVLGLVVLTGVGWVRRRHRGSVA